MAERTGRLPMAGRDERPGGALPPATQVWFPTWVPSRRVVRGAYAAGYWTLVVLAVGALTAAGVVELVTAFDGFGGLSDGDAVLFARVLLAVVVIVAAGFAGGRLAARLGQPPVIGEMTAGFLLGPSLLGALLPEVQRALFPAEVLPHLKVLAQLAVVAFVFLFGADISLRVLSRSVRQVVAVAIGMFVVPVAAGVALAGWLAADHRPAGVPTAAFVVFVGVATGVTAFPVLVRILQETGLDRSRIGLIALTAAGLADAAAWCLLAVAVGTANGDDLGGPAGTFGLVVLFAAATWLVLRPALARFVRLAEARRAPGAVVAAALLLFALGGAWVTDRIGVHAIFGAFFVGLALPRGNERMRRLTRSIERGVRLLLPLFFAVVGLSIGLSFLEEPSQLAVLGVVLLVAVGSKLGGTAVAARLTGLGRRDALAVGVMVNCRGLTELVVLTTGLSLGIIGEELFVMFVLMTLVTTAATGPLLRLLGVRPDAADGTEDAEDDAPDDARPAATPGEAEVRSVRSPA